MPDKSNSVDPVEGSKMWLLPPSESRADLRSETPLGFSQAVYEANSPLNHQIRRIQKKPYR